MADASDAPAMRWWGWGDPAHRPALPAHALRLPRRDAWESRTLPARRSRSSRCGWRRRGSASRRSAALRGIVGGEGVRDDHSERVLHAAGKGYPDLVRLRAGEPEGAPDAVVLPGDHEQVRAVLEPVRRASLAVVPFGGGTSVVGGVAPLRGEHRGVVALDMRRMGEVLELDRESLTVTVQGGARAPALERHLAARGLTLGSLPAVVRVRLAGRLRGHQVGGTGLERLRAHRADGPRPAASPPPRGTSSCPPSRPARRARGCASCWSARRARWA